MTEEEKLDAGLYYDFWDAGVNGRKLNAIKFCRELRKMQDAENILALANRLQLATMYGLVECYHSSGSDSGE